VDSNSFRFTLTSVGDYIPLYVKSINDNSITISSKYYKKSIFNAIKRFFKKQKDSEIHYVIYATRKDIPELEVYSKE